MVIFTIGGPLLGYFFPLTFVTSKIATFPFIISLQ